MALRTYKRTFPTLKAAQKFIKTKKNNEGITDRQIGSKWVYVVHYYK
jgi:hypothetical protein